MSERVCYIRRLDRGGALLGLRLISAHTDDAWHAGNGSSPSLVSDAVSEGAVWIKDRLKSVNSKTKHSRAISVLCLDPDGAVCSWVKPEDANTTLLDSATSDAQDEFDPDALEPETHSGISLRFPQLPLELNFELLDPDETSTGSRAAVMACPDIPGRLLKDELDAMGVRVDCFTTIWHACASAWDSGTNHAHSAQRIVSSDAPITANILIDADDSRLIWTWSREGKLITGGSSRIQTIVGEHETQALIRQTDIARLCSDWLGWSSQLGVSPSRIVCIGNPVQIKASDTTETNEPQDDQSPQGLTPGEIGVALSKAWPDATIDFIEIADPIGETLTRVANDQLSGQIVSLVGLSSRPGRAHRSMLRWTGIALVAIAATIGIFAFELFSQTSEIKDDTKSLSSLRLEKIIEYDNAHGTQLIGSAGASIELTSIRDRLQRNQSPVDLAQSKPIIQELETISYIFAIPDIAINEIKMTQGSVSVMIKVNGIADAEQINKSIAGISGSQLNWHTMTPRNRGDKVEATFVARWLNPEDES